MSFSSRLLGVVLLALLGACGFEPALAPGTQARAVLGDVSLPEPVDRDTFGLNTRLEERLGTAPLGRYRLDVALDVSQRGLAITPEQEITRYNVIGTADWALVDTTDDRVMGSGQVDTFTSYNATGTTVATLAAEEDARARLMVALADQIVTRLSVVGVDR